MKKLTMFYDGLCPLCQAEIQFLSGRNQAGLLSFVDINSDKYAPDHVGVSCDQALASMCAQYDDGELIQGVEVFSAAYSRPIFLNWHGYFLGQHSNRFGMWAIDSSQSIAMPSQHYWDL